MLGLFGKGAGFGIEVGHGVLRAASVSVKSGSLTVAQLDSVELPEGAMTDSFTQPNIVDRAAFIDAARKLAGRMGRRGRQVNVALPDFVSRVVMLDFDAQPKKADDAANMIRWRLKKLMPFDIEQASLRYQYLGAFREKDATTHRYITAVIKSDILSQYENALGEAGMRPGRINIASLAVWNLYHDFVTGDSADSNICFMNLCCGKMTVMVFEGGVIRFLRLKDLGFENRAELNSQAIARELGASLTYYKEHISENQAAIVYIAGDIGDADKVVAEIGAGVGLETRALALDNVIGAGGRAFHGNDAMVFGAACGAAVER